VSSSVGFAAANAFHGPAAAWACDATRRLRYRLFSALWNDCMRVTPTWNNSIHGATDAWVRAAPDSNTWRMHLTHKRSYPVPLGATHLWVRAHVQIWNTIGTGPVIAGFRLYSMNKNPSDAAGPALVPYFVEQVVSRDEGSGAEGSYVLKARVPISRDADGWTTLVLAIAVDPNNESNLDSRTAFRVKAVHCVPLVVDQIGGLGFGGGLGD
jgi:hypothetical protein